MEVVMDDYIFYIILAVEKHQDECSVEWNMGNKGTMQGE